MHQLHDYLSARFPEGTLYKWAKRGKIPAYKVNGRWVFDLDLVDRWLAGERPAAQTPCVSRFQQAKERLQRSLTIEVTPMHPSSLKGVG